MVIGNGMMATAFKELKNDDTVIIFASGVSNSKEKDPEAYQKELAMLDNLKHSPTTLVYFSTCSVFDDSLSDSLYVKHKKDTEKFIEANFKNYWIIRLPNVIGPSYNPHTMMNFLYEVLKNDRPFELQENAVRYFIDVDDVRITVGEMVKNKELGSGMYNLLYPYPFTMLELVKLLETSFSKKGLYTIKKNAGSFYKVKISEQLVPLAHFNMAEQQNYICRIIDKYYK